MISFALVREKKIEFASVIIFDRFIPALRDKRYASLFSINCFVME